MNLIMQCVSIVEYRVRTNAEESESFKPTTGLRQGDPLSPSLFMLCTEGLKDKGTYQEIKSVETPHQ